MSRLSFVVLAVAALICLTTVSSQTCGGAGYDLSALAGQQYSYFDAATNYTYSATICSNVVNASACPCVDSSSLCQSSPGYCGTSLSSYSIANSTWNENLNGKGVTQNTNDGEYCSAEGGVAGGYRKSSFVYLCDASATTPRFLNVTEVHTCFYTAYIATAAACTKNSNAATGPYAGVGTSYSYYDSSCGGSAYPLSTLTAQGDLFWSPTTATSSNVWFLRVCGSVSNPNCTATAGTGDSSIPATQTAMLCQSDQTSPTDYAASFYVPGQQLWTLTSTGITMQIQDGQSCGPNFPRETTINFVCDSTASTAVLVSVVEVTTCYYTATVRTNQVCSDKFLTGSTGAAQPQQSSGGAQQSSGGAAVQSSSGGTVTPPGGGNGAASTTVSAVVVAAVMAVAALML